MDETTKQARQDGVADPPPATAAASGAAPVSDVSISAAPAIAAPPSTPMETPAPAAAAKQEEHSVPPPTIAPPPPPAPLVGAPAPNHLLQTLKPPSPEERNAGNRRVRNYEAKPFEAWGADHGIGGSVLKVEIDRRAAIIFIAAADIRIAKKACEELLGERSRQAYATDAGSFDRNAYELHEIAETHGHQEGHGLTECLIVNTFRVTGALRLPFPNFKLEAQLQRCAGLGMQVIVILPSLGFDAERKREDCYRNRSILVEAGGWPLLESLVLKIAPERVAEVKEVHDAKKASLQDLLDAASDPARLAELLDAGPKAHAEKAAMIVDKLVEEGSAARLAAVFSAVLLTKPAFSTFAEFAQAIARTPNLGRAKVDKDGKALPPDIQVTDWTLRELGLVRVGRGREAYISFREGGPSLGTAVMQELLSSAPQACRRMLDHALLPSSFRCLGRRDLEHLARGAIDLVVEGTDGANEAIDAIAAWLERIGNAGAGKEAIGLLHELIDAMASRLADECRLDHLEVLLDLFGKVSRSERPEASSTAIDFAIARLLAAKLADLCDGNLITRLLATIAGSSPGLRTMFLARIGGEMGFAAAWVGNDRIDELLAAVAATARTHADEVTRIVAVRMLARLLPYRLEISMAEAGQPVPMSEKAIGELLQLIAEGDKWRDPTRFEGEDLAALGSDFWTQLTRHHDKLWPLLKSVEADERQALAEAQCRFFCTLSVLHAVTGMGELRDDPPDELTILFNKLQPFPDAGIGAAELWVRDGSGAGGVEGIRAFKALCRHLRLALPFFAIALAQARQSEAAQSTEVTVDIVVELPASVGEIVARRDAWKVLKSRLESMLETVDATVYQWRDLLQAEYTRDERVRQARVEAPRRRRLFREFRARLAAF